MRKDDVEVGFQGRDYLWWKVVVSSRRGDRRGPRLVLDIIAIDQIRARVEVEGMLANGMGIESITLHGSSGEYYTYLANKIQARLSEDDHQI